MFRTALINPPRSMAAAMSLVALSACGGGNETGPVQAGPPANLVASAGNRQAGVAGQLLGAPIAAKVTDASGTGVPNLPVDFAVIAGGGTIVSTSSRTNGAGIVTATWRVGTVAGREQRVVATVLDTLTGALVDTAHFTATVAPGAPATVVTLSGSGQIVGLGEPLPAPLRVLIRDAYGNATPDVQVSWVVVSGTATLASATTVTDAQGVTSNSATVGQTEGDVEVRASITGVSPVSFLATIRRVTTRLTTLSGAGYGIARTPDGHLLVTLIYSGAAQRISIANPSSSTTTAIGELPVVIAADEAGQFAYTAHMAGPSSVSVIDIASMNEVANILIPGEAHALALSPRGDRLYVTNTSNSVFTVDVATRTIIRTTSVGSGPWGIAFWTTATDSLMYVTARNGTSVSEIDMRTGNVVRTMALPAGARPHGIAIAPNGSTLYISDDSNGEVLFVNRATGAITTRLPTPGAWGMAVTPDGSTLFVTTNHGYFIVVDVPSATITKRYWADSQPREILVMPDGRTAMSANLGGWIDVVTK